MERDKDDKSAEEGSLWLAGVKGFEPLIYSLGGCRLVLARLHAHDGFLEGETGISRFPTQGIVEYLKSKVSGLYRRWEVIDGSRGF